jgi:hypothetical protein
MRNGSGMQPSGRGFRLETADQLGPPIVYESFPGFVDRGQRATGSEEIIESDIFERAC